jgi:minor fimbrial subunit
MLKSIFKPALLVLAMASTAAMAADPVNINITGKVVASPCQVNNGAADLAIDLGQNIQASTLQTAGSGSTLVSQDLTLTNCPAGTTSVKATFTGTADTTSPTMYKNTGTATPLAVELSNGADSSLLSNGATVTQNVQADKTVTYQLQARAYTATGSVMPGTINAVVVADFTYQ